MGHLLKDCSLWRVRAGAGETCQEEDPAARDCDGPHPHSPAPLSRGSWGIKLHKLHFGKCCSKFVFVLHYLNLF